MSKPDARRAGALARVEAGIVHVRTAAADPGSDDSTAALAELVEVLDDLHQADRRAALIVLADQVDVLEIVTCWMSDAGRVDEARLWLTDVVKATDDAAVRVLLGRLLTAQHQLQAASDQAARVLATNPVDLDALMLAGDVAIAQADTAERAGDVNAAQAARHEALRIGGRLTTLAPAEPAFWAALAEVHVELDEGDLAAAAYDRALELAPDDPALQAALGLFHARSGRYPEAEEAYRRAVALDPEFVPNRLALAQFLAGAGRHGEARDELTEILDTDPLSLDALVLAANLAVNIADVAENEGDAAAAQAALREALRAFKRLEVPLATNPSLWMAAAEVHGRLDESDDAVAAWSRALELAPDDPDVQMKVGLFYEDRRQWAEALAHYERTIELAPDSSIAWRNQGDALAGLDRGQEAEEAFRRAVALDPEFVPNRLALAHFLAGAGRHGEARDELTEMLDTDPLSLDDLLAAGDLAMDIADVAENEGDAAAAQAALREALRAFKRLEVPLATNPSLWMAAAEVHGRLDESDDAVAAWSRALELAPDDPDVQMKVGLFYEDRRQWAEALAHYERTIELAPDSSIAWRNQGDALAGLDRGQEAEEAFRRAVALDPEFVPNRLALAHFLAGAGRHGEARDELTEILDTDPLSLDDLLAAGDLAMDIADVAENEGDAAAAQAALREALRAYERFRGRAPAEADTWIATGAAQARLGAASDAVAAYSQAFDLHPERTDALIGRGFALIDGGQLHRADWDFEHVLEVGAAKLTDIDRTRALLGRAEALIALSEFYGTKDLYQRAADCAERALESAQLVVEAPSDVGVLSAHWLAGQALSKLKAYDQAMEQFDLAIDAGRSEPIPWWLSYDRSDAARSHAEVSGDLDLRAGVLTSLQQLAASTADPEERLTALGLAGLALLEFDEPSTAARVLGEALKDNDTYYWAHGLLGRAHALVGSRPDAITELRIAASAEADAGTRLDATVGLELLGAPQPVVEPDGNDEPTDTELEPAEARVSARMSRATALERFGAVAMATDEYRRALAEEPSSLVAKNGLAWHLVDQVGTPEALDEAIVLAEAAGELEQDDDRTKGNYLDTLGWALFLKGEFIRAAGVLDQAVRLAPFDFEIRLHDLQARGRASPPSTPQDGSGAL